MSPNDYNERFYQLVRRESFYAKRLSAMNEEICEAFLNISRFLIDEGYVSNNAREVDNIVEALPEQALANMFDDDTFATKFKIALKAVNPRLNENALSGEKRQAAAIALRLLEYSKNNATYLKPGAKAPGRDPEGASGEYNPKGKEKKPVGGSGAIDASLKGKVSQTEEVETVDEDAKYDRNRKRAAQRAAARNAARDAGKTGVVPGVGYVSPRREKETYVDSAGVTRHKSGAKNEEVEYEVEEGYKPIDKKKETAMYRRAGNLARTSLSSKGKKKEEAQTKSARIVSAISSQKERERFAKMGDEKARDNYKEEVEQVDEIAPAVIAGGAALAAAPYLMKKFAKPAADRALDNATKNSNLPLSTGGGTADLRKAKQAAGMQVNSHEPEGELIENRRAARAAGGSKDDSKKQPDPSKDGFTGMGNMSIDQIRKMSARIEKEKTKKEEVEIQEEEGKKDACYKKVKARYDVWPSAYASGALVKCRQKGAANWGNKSEAFDIDALLNDPIFDQITEEELLEFAFDIFEEMEQEDILTEAAEYFDDMLMEADRYASAVATSKANARAQRKARVMGAMKKAAGAVKSAGSAAGGRAAEAAKRTAGAVKRGAETAGRAVGAAARGGASLAKRAAVKGAAAAGEVAGAAKGGFEAGRIKAKRQAMSQTKPQSKPASSSSSSDDGTKGKLDGLLKSVRGDSKPAASSSSSSGGSSSGGSSSSSSSSSGGGSSDSGTQTRKRGLLRRVGSAIKSTLKKAVGKTARGISNVSGAAATRLGEDTEFDIVLDYLLEYDVCSIDEAEEVMMELTEEEIENILTEREMTAADKAKEEKLKKKYDDSGMKASMKKKYGKEEGKKIYFATIRKQAMDR